MKFKRFVFIFLLIFFPLVVSANSLECPKFTFAGSEISCNLRIENVIGVSANYKLDEGISVLGFSINDKWKIYYQDKLGFAIGNIINNTGVSAVIKLKISDTATTNKDYIIDVSNILGVDINNKLYNIQNISSIVRVVSNTSYLKKLMLSNMSFTSEFKKDKYVYYAETIENSTVISAVADDSSYSVSGDLGLQKLNYGINLFNIKVSNSYGGVNNYKIYITRNYTSSDMDSLLKSLNLSVGEINFKSDKYLYEVFVPNNIETIVVDAVANSANAIVKIDKPEKLVVGENQIIITVTAVNKSQIKYVLIVNRDKESISDNEEVKKNKTLLKISIFVVTFILVIILCLILLWVIKKMINFIKNNKH